MHYHKYLTYQLKNRYDCLHHKTHSLLISERVYGAFLLEWANPFTGLCFGASMFCCL